MPNHLHRRAFIARGAAAAAAAGALAVLAVARAGAAAAGGHPPGPVILVDWDGVDPCYLDLHLAGRMPALHALAGQGVRAVASGTYKAVSNPNRAGLATGARPAVHLNTAYVLDPGTGKARGQNRAVHAETLFQALRRQGRTLLSAGWYIVEGKGADRGDPEALYVQGETWRENVDAVVAALLGEPVKADGGPVRLPRVPDLIAAYAADADAIGHKEGPSSPRIPAALSELDAGLGRIAAAVRRAGLERRASFVFVSDHGMTGYTESLEPAVLGALSDAGFSAQRLHSGQAPDPGTEVVLTASPRAANAYLRGAAAQPAGRDRVERVLRGLDVLEGVYDRAELDAMGAAPDEGDLAVDARPPYAFIDPADLDGAERGGHASLREATAPLVLSGAGVVPGARPDAPRTIDVAPTIARLLGADPPARAEGRALDEVLRPDPRV
ncbi:alkaline phosphatase family protein [Nocardiopsis sp. CNT-189]|uniref:alkaline phosphatase family protein n=1 Tax=Nocardiopsis oceanisediminis TaxID=2816862 RepID=UPI003B2E5588